MRLRLLERLRQLVSWRPRSQADPGRGWAQDSRPREDAGRHRRGPRSHPLLAAGTHSRRVSPATARCSPRRGCRSSPRGGSRRRWFHRPRCFPGGRPGSGVRLREFPLRGSDGLGVGPAGPPSRGTTRREQVAVAGRLAASRAVSPAVRVTAGRPVPADVPTPWRCRRPGRWPRRRRPRRRRPVGRRPRRRRPFMGPAKWPAWRRSPRWRHLRKR